MVLLDQHKQDNSLLPSIADYNLHPNDFLAPPFRSNDRAPAHQSILDRVTDTPTPLYNYQTHQNLPKFFWLILEINKLYCW